MFSFSCSRRVSYPRQLSPAVRKFQQRRLRGANPPCSLGNSLHIRTSGYNPATGWCRFGIRKFLRRLSLRPIRSCFGFHQLFQRYQSRLRREIPTVYFWSNARRSHRHEGGGISLFVTQPESVPNPWITSCSLTPRETVFRTSPIRSSGSIRNHPSFP